MSRSAHSICTTSIPPQYPLNSLKRPSTLPQTLFGGSGDPAYPGGGFFNFAKLGTQDMKKMQTKEVKNGRLAMMGFLGCIVQAGCQPGFYFNVHRVLRRSHGEHSALMLSIN